MSALGKLGAPMTIARTSAARANGFPQLVRAGGDLYFAWTEAGRASRIRAARMSLGMARDLG